MSEHIETELPVATTAESLDVAEISTIAAEQIAIEQIAIEQVAIEQVAPELAASELAASEELVALELAAPEKPVQRAAESGKTAIDPELTALVQQMEFEFDSSESEPEDTQAATKSKKKKVKIATGFAALGLPDEIQQAIQKSGYDTPTPIQTEIIPHMLAGRDVLAQSQTGTGKTAAFALPILSRIDMSKQYPQVLILAPTRELAIQVAASFTTYASFMKGLQVTAIYGGADYDAQFRQLRKGPQIVVGTPGRVIDHVNRGTLKLGEISCLVLDEADEMLNMGFHEDVEFVLAQTPANRQVALFSATLPPPIREIAKKYLNDPARITIQNKTMTAENTRQRALFVSPRDRIEVLTRMLEVEPSDGVIVFTQTREASVAVADKLSDAGFSAIAINGDMAQKVRERTIEGFKSGKTNILVATDVAARGLDVSRVSHVFKFDLPHDAQSYVHRIGRTGRAGRSGEAVIFMTHSQRGKLRHIERVTNQPVEMVQPPTAREINALRIERFKQRITETAAGADLKMFREMVTTLAAESGTPIDLIAAALAEIGQQGRSFFVSDKPQPKPPANEGRHSGDRGRDRFEQNDRGPRPDRNESGGFDSRPRRGGKGDSPLAPPEPGMQRYRIEVGRRDGVRPGNIVGAVANEAGIEGGYIGPIKIHDSYSTIDLPEGLPRDVHQTLQKTRVAGKELRMSDAIADEAAAFPRRGKHFSTQRPVAGSPRGKFAGKKSFGEKSFGDKTFGEKPRGDRKFGDKKFADKKFGDKKFGAKSRGNKIKASKGPALKASSPLAQGLLAGKQKKSKDPSANVESGTE